MLIFIVSFSSLVQKGNSIIQISTFAGSGFGSSTGENGPASSATINLAQSMWGDSMGTIYISDFNGYKIRSVSAPSNIITTYAGTGILGSTGNGGSTTSALIGSPCSVAGFGNIVYYVDEQANLVRQISLTTNIITAFAGTGILDTVGNGGKATSASFNDPNHVCADTAGNVYVNEYSGYVIRKITGGTTIVSTFAGVVGIAGGGGYGGPGTSATFDIPYQMYCDFGGTYMFFAENNGNILRVNLLNGILVRWVNALSDPVGVTGRAAGMLYISESSGHRLDVVDSAQAVSRLAGTGTSGSSGDGGAPTSARLSFPGQLFMDSSSRLYIADGNNNKVRLVMDVVVTASPSVVPTVRPISPTSQPSRQPSVQPTSQPSRQPSAQPSRQPSTQPLVRPSGQPSGWQFCFRC
jgi:hypothetical protein